MQFLEAKFDPMGVIIPLLHAPLAWMAHPLDLARAMRDFSARLTLLQWHSLGQLAGLDSPDVEPTHPDDTRFIDLVWTEVPAWHVTMEWYLAITRHVQDMLFNTPGLSEKERVRAAFWWRQWLNALAPTNFFLTNPVAQRKAAETGGASLRRGWESSRKTWRPETFA
jgi:polyhydroxyalkanoate synthase